MLLVFTPCLYCDVSDAWTFAGKWQRIAVSAAGIAVEVFLASVATFLWWYSQPGLARSLCLNVMVVCSVSTLLFNGNPLVRYDGYHALADLLEIPNLAEQSQAVLGRVAAWVFLGVRRAAGRMLPEKGHWFLGLYGAASLAYRWFISLAILWLAHRVTKSYGLAAIGNVLAIAVVAGLVLLPAWRLAAFLRHESLGRGFHRMRAVFLLALWAGAIAVLALIPLPCRVSAPVVLEPENARPVYAVVAGTLVRSANPGDPVEKDQELARLVNLDVRKEIVELTGTRNQQRRQVEVMRLRQAQDRSIAALIPTAEAALTDLQQRLEQRQRDEQSLILRAPAGGIVLPPPRLIAPAPAFGQLGTWKGTPLDEQNRDCHVETGTLVCMVGSPQPLEAFAVINQDDVALVREGQRVRIRLDFLPARIFYGIIVEIAKSDLKMVPRELASGADLAVRVDPRGVARPLSISYQARVRLDEQPDVSLLGSRGQAKILVEPQSLAEQLYRGLRQTFEVRW
jgi:putative peptide zinc metalloprotease protein